MHSAGRHQGRCRRRQASRQDRHRHRPGGCARQGVSEAGGQGQVRLEWARAGGDSRVGGGGGAYDGEAGRPSRCRGGRGGRRRAPAQRARGSWTFPPPRTLPRTLPLSPTPGPNSNQGALPPNAPAGQYALGTVRPGGDGSSRWRVEAVVGEARSSTTPAAGSAGRRNGRSYWHFLQVSEYASK